MIQKLPSILLLITAYNYCGKVNCNHCKMSVSFRYSCISELQRLSELYKEFCENKMNCIGCNLSVNGSYQCDARYSLKRYVKMKFDEEFKDE